MNRATVCRAKCLDKVTLKVLPTSCFRYKSEEKKQKIPESKNRKNRAELIRVSPCKFFNKMFRGFRENGKLLKIFLSIYLEKFTHSFQSFTKCFPLLIA